MALLSLESGTTAYQADFVVYGAAVPLLLGLIAALAPTAMWPALSVWVLAGLAGWSLVEYVLHRFVLHGVQPFSRWHGEHHRRPGALIGTPTVMSAGLFLTLVFLPVWGLAGAWPAAALMLGLLAGYLAYGVIHHLTHHAAPAALNGTAWLRRRRQWHALHHQRREAPGRYGVTTGFWDHVFGSIPPVLADAPAGPARPRS